jgi:3',5'-cyclic AMP phosphodiesterase CpdA
MADMAYNYRILHVADPHFSRCHFSGNPVEVGRRHAEELLGVLEGYQLSSFFDCMVLSGDFTFGCDQGGFDAAIEFIRILSKHVPAGGILVIPGNHDIDLGTPVRIRKLSLPTSQEEAEKPFRDFLAALRVGGPQPNHYLAGIKRIQRRGQKGLVLIGLNSCRVERRDAQGWGYVGPDQIAQAAQSLLAPGDETQARNDDTVIAIMHHNPLPIWDVGIQTLNSVPQRRKFSFVMDAAGTLSFLADLGIAILLHGHTHIDSYKRVEGYGTTVSGTNMIILGAGSLGILGGKGDPPHHFQILEIDDDTVMCQNLTCPFHEPDSDRRWNRASRKKYFLARWNAKHTANALESRLAECETAGSDFERYQSWSVLRARRLEPESWEAVVAALHERVRRIERSTMLDQLKALLGEIFNKPPTAEELCEWTLEQYLVHRIRTDNHGGRQSAP